MKPILIYIQRQFWAKKTHLPSLGQFRFTRSRDLKKREPMGKVFSFKNFWTRLLKGTKYTCVLAKFALCCIRNGSPHWSWKFHSSPTKKGVGAKTFNKAVMIELWLKAYVRTYIRSFIRNIFRPIQSHALHTGTEFQKYLLNHFETLQFNVRKFLLKILYFQ